MWKQFLDRWDYSIDVLIWKRSKRGLKALDWDILSKLDPISAHELQSADLKQIYAVLDDLAVAAKETSEKRRSISCALRGTAAHY